MGAITDIGRMIWDIVRRHAVSLAMAYVGIAIIWNYIWLYVVVLGYHMAVGTYAVVSMAGWSSSYVGFLLLVAFFPEFFIIIRKILKIIF